MNLNRSSNESHTEADEGREDSVSGLPTINERLCKLDSINVLLYNAGKDN